MNNFYKTSPRIRTIVPHFLLHILAPNKIKRPILRKKGDCSQWPFWFATVQKVLCLFIFEIMQMVLAASY